MVLGVYVDDFYLVAPEEGMLEMKKLKKHFDITYECEDSFRFLGIHRFSKDGQDVDHMIPYIDVLLKDFKDVLN